MIRCGQHSTSSEYKPDDAIFNKLIGDQSRPESTYTTVKTLFNEPIGRPIWFFSNEFTRSYSLRYVGITLLTLSLSFPCSKEHERASCICANLR